MISFLYTQSSKCGPAIMYSCNVASQLVYSMPWLMKTRVPNTFITTQSTCIDSSKATQTSQPCRSFSKSAVNIKWCPSTCTPLCCRLWCDLPSGGTRCSHSLPWSLSWYTRYHSIAWLVCQKKPSRCSFTLCLFLCSIILPYLSLSICYALSVFIFFPLNPQAGRPQSNECGFCPVPGLTGGQHQLRNAIQ